MIRALLTGFALSLVAGVATAGSAEDRLQAAIAECRAVTTAIGRLDCYDAIALPDVVVASEGAAVGVAENEAASGAAEAAVAAGVTAQATAGEARAAEEAEFGFEFDVKDALDSVTSDVNEIRKNAKGGLVLTLANDQVWQQNDGQLLFLDEGDSVTITRGALSAFYLMKEGKGRRYKFTRVR